ncbi:proto-oncogene DBL isoform X2 [Polypterus senegalus]|uniref:proto-oncogene DBL isoform X2 n=1 Tax=Polypterus senegalus TaxID=55291 RepID=UPI001962FD77|nr:proto-oncogene DBL isoform X2 [Polypterus senegalus]
MGTSPQEPLRISETEMESYYGFLKAGSQLESTLQNAALPLYIKEIRDYMDSQIAYLSGGRGEESSFVITLPECSSFHEVPEDALTKVLTYLTMIPRKQEPGIKFILIVDRRMDTWASIKATLSRIAASFPGNLHLVLVLRPTGFIQRTVTDIGFRFSQEDFMLKMPVVMLSSVTDLLRYIDENQLTPEYGGTLEYCHSDWIVLRTAIENFAVTVKEIAQQLQAFGTELAETEIPNEVNLIEALLVTQKEKYKQLKEDIRLVMRQGGQLLANLEDSGSEEADAEQKRNASQDWETVHRLLGQLHEMETAFDGFWEKHQLKLKQYLQLWRFEQSFQEMQASLEALSAQERSIPTVGESIIHTEQMIRELGSLEKQCQDEMSEAQILILQGHQLAANHHYAMALICQRCNELRHFSDVLTANLRAKWVALSHSRELQARLDEALRWCNEGAYLLANQQVDKFQTKEGAQEALRDIDRFQEGAVSPLIVGSEFLNPETESVLSPQLKAQVTEVQEKVMSVRGMLQNRQVCLRKLADKQVRPVQLVAPRPEHPPRSKSPLFSPKHGVDFNSSIKFSFDLSLPGKRTSRKSPSSRKIEVMHDYQETRNSLSFSLDCEDSPEMQKRHVMKELIDTERVYVEELLSVLLGYRAEMDNPALSPLLPPLLRDKKSVLFGNMAEIYNFHSRIFLNALERCLETPERVGYCFLERKSNFQMYEQYCQNKPRSELLWRQCSDSLFFQECQKKLDHKLGLDSYLLKPIQRLTKYQLLLKELLKYSVSSEGSKELEEALEAMLQLLKSVNDSMHQISITGYDGDLDQLGRLLMQGSFSVWISHKKGPTKMKDLARFKPMQRHLFLYESALLFCKKRDEHGEGYDKTPSYSFKHYLKMSAVGITENVKGDAKKFEIWYSGREEVYVVQASSMDVKLAWLNEIRKVLTNQQKHLRDGSYNFNPTSQAIELSPPLYDSSKRQRASFSSEENESGRTSPVMLGSSPGHVENLSPEHQPQRRSWSGLSHSVDICEGLEDWTVTNDISNPSDTEEEDEEEEDEEEGGVLLTLGRYSAIAECRRGSSDNPIIRIGDDIQVLQEDQGNMWLVKNLTSRMEGWIHGSSLQMVIGESQVHSGRLSDPGNLKTRKLSSP